MNLRLKRGMQFLTAVYMMCFMCSCSKDGNNDSIKTGSNKNILKEYTKFEVPISGTVKTVEQIGNTSYYLNPASPYGMPSMIDFLVNKDGKTIDVLWTDTNNKRHLTRVSLETQKIVEEITIPEIANTGRFLGIESIGTDKYIIGYSKDNAFVNKDEELNKDAEAWFTAFEKTGNILYSTRIFGEKDLNEVWSKGRPSQAGSSVIKYSEKDNIIALYLSHTMKWDDNVRHQAGWIGFLDARTGKLLQKEDGIDKDGNKKYKIIGNSWYFSHNFDQRCIVSSTGEFYTLAHGDCYSRALALNKWSHTYGQESRVDYYEIKNGKPGDNTTLTNTGDLVELSDGNVAIAFSTEDNRSQRDLKVSITTGIKGEKPSVIKETWITKNSTSYVGWGTKIANYGENILVAWNSFDKVTKPVKGMGTSFVLLDANGEILSTIEKMDETILQPTQSIKNSIDNRTLIFVSATTEGKLQVNLINVK